MEPASGAPVLTASVAAGGAFLLAHQNVPRPVAVRRPPLPQSPPPPPPPAASAALVAPALVSPGPVAPAADAPAPAAPADLSAGPARPSDSAVEPGERAKRLRQRRAAALRAHLAAVTRATEVLQARGAEAPAFGAFGPVSDPLSWTLLHALHRDMRTRTWYDPFATAAQQPKRPAEVTFNCEHCSRLVVVGKFAPHLEKCLGRNGLGSRAARHRRVTTPVNFGFAPAAALAADAYGAAGSASAAAASAAAAAASSADSSSPESSAHATLGGVGTPPPADQPPPALAGGFSADAPIDLALDEAATLAGGAGGALLGDAGALFGDDDDDFEDDDDDSDYEVRGRGGRGKRARRPKEGRGGAGAARRGRGRPRKFAAVVG
jgi:hypothetical protein